MRERETHFCRSSLINGWRRLGCKAALLAALGVPSLAGAGDGDVDRPPEQAKTSWLGRMFGKSDDSSGIKDADGKNIPRADKIPSKKSSEANRQEALSLEGKEKKLNAVRMREEANLFRRQAVCDELKNIAVETNNDALWRRAEELDRRAYAIYSQRVGKRLVNKAAADADERVLDKNLGEVPGKGVRRSDKSARAHLEKDQNGRASAGEE